MTPSSENSLNALSSWLIGVVGAGMILVPRQFLMVNFSVPPWVVALLGLFCFLAGVVNQTAFVLTASRRRIVFYRSLSVFFLFVLTFFFIACGCVVEGFIFGFVGIVQLILVTPLKEPFAHSDPLHLAFVFSGFSGGIYLALSGASYDGVDIGASKNILAGLFLAATTFEVARKTFFPKKYETLLSRVQVVSWLAWCFAFLPSFSVAHLAAPSLLASSILFNGFFPWERLKLPDNDILGRRVVNIAAILGTALLVFLGALLSALDSTLTASFIDVRGAAFLFFVLIVFVLYYEVATIVMMVNGLMRELAYAEEETDSSSDNAEFFIWKSRMKRYLKPFKRSHEDMQTRLIAQSDQISLLSRHFNNEKKRNAQITLLLELSQQLESQLDQPVAAQLTVNSLERAVNCDLACIFVHEPDQKEVMLLSAAGKQIYLIPAGFRQNVSKGMIGRAFRQRKTQIANDTRLDADYVAVEDGRNLSSVVIPLIFNGYVNGAITLDSEKLNAFTSADIWLAELAAAELTRAWERARYHQRLMNLVQTGSQLSAVVQPETTVLEVASIAREILQARFTFVQIHLGQERNFVQSASSGEAPRLLASLEDSSNSESLVQLAFHAIQPFRVRDVRKYAPTSRLVIDHAGLRSMLAIPIRWHRLSIGTILAFGKQNEVFFNENDQALAELLSIQAGGAFESAWLQQELRGSLRTTSLLYRLSTQIIQTDNLQNAALDIVQTAHKIAKSLATGIVIFNLEGKISAEAQVDSSGIHTGFEHPLGLIKDVMASGQLIYLSQGNSMTRACLPIQTPILKYGVLWLDMPDEAGNKSVSSPSDLQALVNQTAIALERSALLVESRRQAAEIKTAYNMLEATYDQTLAALMSALDARDRETEGHSSRVSQFTAKLGKVLHFSHEQLKVLERGSLLHDIGKIGISDTILHKPGPLSDEEWVVMRRHPDIGAKIVEGIPFLQDTIPLIRHHQERWNGSGYPEGLKGEEIPILARMFAIVDAFDALTSNRPYRQRISTQDALAYLREQAGILFDPRIVETFEQLLRAENLAAPLCAEEDAK